MNLTADLRSAIARVARLKSALPDNVIDLERVRLQRELRAIRERVSDAEWDEFTRGLVAAMADRMRFGMPVRRGPDRRTAETSERKP